MAAAREAAEAAVREAEAALAAAKQALRDAKIQPYLHFAEQVLIHHADMQKDYWVHGYYPERDIVPFDALKAAARLHGFVLEEENTHGDGRWYSVTRKKSAAAAADEA